MYNKPASPIFGCTAHTEHCRSPIATLTGTPADTPYHCPVSKPAAEGADTTLGSKCTGKPAVFKLKVNKNNNVQIF